MTKKELREKGYLTKGDFNKKKVFPKVGATTVNCKGEEFYSPEDLIEVDTKTNWSRRGFKVPDDAEPITQIKVYAGGRWRKCDAYSNDNLQEKRKHRTKEPKIIDIALATFTVNRYAKRCRDNASSFYGNGSYGLSTYKKEEKEKMYELKERGIYNLWNEKRLEIVGRHGDLILYKSDGYYFHSPSFPKEVSIEEIEFINDDIDVYIEKKEKEKSEARLKDAKETLSTLSKMSGWEKIQRKDENIYYPDFYDEDNEEYDEDNEYDEEEVYY